MWMFGRQVRKRPWGPSPRGLPFSKSSPRCKPLPAGRNTSQSRKAVSGGLAEMTQWSVVLQQQGRALGGGFFTSNHFSGKVWKPLLSKLGPPAWKVS